MSEKKITSAEVGPMPRPMPEGMFDAMPWVTVTYEGGETEKLFQFYPDEISFTGDELVGLTRGEAVAKKRTKEKAYLQS